MSEIELISIDGRPDEKPWLSVAKCRELMPPRFFSAAQVFSPTEPPPGSYEWRYLPAGDVHAYSRFCIRDLAGVVRGSHILLVQNDGYILRPDLWDPAWLQYDYIGAPWPAALVGGEEAKRVGNGGFSLRSWRLLYHCSKLDFEEGVNEDVQICQSRRHVLERAGIKFAPLEVARRFSVEWDMQHGPTFGFHGATGIDGREVLR